MIPSDLLRRFEDVCDDLRDAGINVVAVLSAYAEGDTHFSTRLGVSAQPECGVSEDRVVLDAQREIITQWHQANHRDDDCDGCAARRKPAPSSPRPMALTGASGRGRRLMWAIDRPVLAIASLLFPAAARAYLIRYEGYHPRRDWGRLTAINLGQEWSCEFEEGDGKVSGCTVRGVIDLIRIVVATPPTRGFSFLLA